MSANYLGYFLRHEDEKQATAQSSPPWTKKPGHGILNPTHKNSDSVCDKCGVSVSSAAFGDSLKTIPAFAIAVYFANLAE